MSKTIPAAIQTTLDGDSWTFATIWTITRADATVFRFTDHDADIEYSGNTYEAKLGYVSKSITRGIDGAPDNSEITGIISDLGVTPAQLRSGYFDAADYEVSLIDWAAPANGVVPLSKGKLGKVSIDSGQFMTELRGIAQALLTNIGRLITPGCDYALGDADCKVVLTSHTETGNVPGVWIIDAIRWTVSDWGLSPGTIFSREIQVRATAGGADQCTPDTNASASSEQSGTYSADKSFDDDTGTSWRTSGAGPHWLKFDFDSPATLYEYWMDSASTSSGNWIDWIVEVQLVGSTDWTLVHTITGEDWGGSPPSDTVFEAFRANGTETGSSIDFYDPARSEADGYWRDGRITFTSGDNVDLTFDVKDSFDTGYIVLWEPTPFPIKVNDGYSIVRGCQKSVAACKGYSNIVNHGGFPYVVGVPDLIRGPQ